MILIKQSVLIVVKLAHVFCFLLLDNFSRLSDEMILSVFKWLPKKALIRCSLVSHRFDRLSQDESLWTRLDLAGKVLQPHALGRILMRGVVILRLAQCKVRSPTDIF